MMGVIGMNAPALIFAEHERAQAVSALASDFVHRRLPRALALQAQLGEGEPIGDDDAAFLADTVDTLAAASALFGQNPELNALHRCALGLCDDIMTEASARA
jgi:hypothetical protein